MKHLCVIAMIVLLASTAGAIDSLRVTRTDARNGWNGLGYTNYLPHYQQLLLGNHYTGGHHVLDLDNLANIELNRFYDAFPMGLPNAYNEYGMYYYTYESDHLFGVYRLTRHSFVRLGLFTIDFAGTDEYMSLYVFGDRLYLFNRGNLTIVSLEDPRDPVMLSTTPTDTLHGYPVGVVGDYLLYYDSYSPPGNESIFQCFQVGDPDNVELVTTFTCNPGLRNSTFRIVDDVLFLMGLATYQNHIYSFGLTDLPESLPLLDSLRITSFNDPMGGGWWHLHENYFLAIGLHDPDVDVYSIEDPGNISLHTSFPGINNRPCKPFYSRGDTVLVRDQDTLFTTLFNADTGFEVIGRYTQRMNFTSTAIVANHLLAVDDDSLLVFSLDDPSRPNQIGEAFAPGANIVKPFGEYAFLHGPEGQGYLAELSDPGAPVVTALQDTHFLTTQPLNDTMLASIGPGNFLYLYTVQDPDALELLNTPLELPALGTSLDIEVSGDILYCNGSELTAVNIANPANPEILYNESPFNTYRSFIELDDELMYLYDDALTILDMSDPEDPVLLCDDVYYRFSMANSVAKHWDYLLVTGRWGDILVWEVSDPSDPSWIGLYDSREYTYSPQFDGHAAFHNGFVYAAEKQQFSVYDVREAMTAEMLLPAGVEAFWEGERLVIPEIDIFNPGVGVLRPELESVEWIYNPPFIPGRLEYTLTTPIRSGENGTFEIIARQGAWAQGAEFAGYLALKHEQFNTLRDTVWIYTANRAPEGLEVSLPGGLAITGTYPNPFNNQIRIDYALPETGEVKLLVYDLLGRQVATLHNGLLEAGFHTIAWDGHNNSGQKVASGTYVLRLEQHGHLETRTVRLVK